MTMSPFPTAGAVSPAAPGPGTMARPPSGEESVSKAQEASAARLSAHAAELEARLTALRRSAEDRIAAMSEQVENRNAERSRTIAQLEAEIDQLQRQAAAPTTTAQIAALRPAFASGGRVARFAGGGVQSARAFSSEYAAPALDSASPAPGSQFGPPLDPAQAPAAPPATPSPAGQSLPVSNAETAYRAELQDIYFREQMAIQELDEEATREETDLQRQAALAQTEAARTRDALQQRLDAARAFFGLSTAVGRGTAVRAG